MLRLLKWLPGVVWQANGLSSILGFISRLDAA